MKNKVIRLLFAFILLSALNTNAQIFTAKAGFGLSTMNEDGNGLLYDLKPGIHAGISAELPVYKWLAIEPAILYSNKGAKYKEGTSATDIHATINLHYLDIPVNFVASKVVEGNMRLFVSAGPYVGIGLSGRIKGEVETKGIKETTNVAVAWGNDANDFFKRVELGAVFGAGIDVRKIQYSFSYDLGLTNIASKGEDSYSLKNRVLKFSIGYRFGRS